MVGLSQEKLNKMTQVNSVVKVIDEIVTIADNSKYEDLKEDCLPNSSFNEIIESEGNSSTNVTKSGETSNPNNTEINVKVEKPTKGILKYQRTYSNKKVDFDMNIDYVPFDPTKDFTIEIQIVEVMPKKIVSYAALFAQQKKDEEERKRKEQELVMKEKQKRNRMTRKEGKKIKRRKSPPDHMMLDVEKSGEKISKDVIRNNEVDDGYDEEELSENSYLTDTDGEEHSAVIELSEQNKSEEEHENVMCLTKESLESINISSTTLSNKTEELNSNISNQGELQCYNIESAIRELTLEENDVMTTSISNYHDQSPRLDHSTSQNSEEEKSEQEIIKNSVKYVTTDENEKLESDPSIIEDLQCDDIENLVGELTLEENEETSMQVSISSFHEQSPRLDDSDTSEYTEEEEESESCQLIDDSLTFIPIESTEILITNPSIEVELRNDNDKEEKIEELTVEENDNSDRSTPCHMSYDHSDSSEHSEEEQSEQQNDDRETENLELLELFSVQDTESESLYNEVKQIVSSQEESLDDVTESEISYNNEYLETDETSQSCSNEIRELPISEDSSDLSELSDEDVSMLGEQGGGKNDSSKIVIDLSDESKTEDSYEDSSQIERSISENGTKSQETNLVLLGKKENEKQIITKINSGNQKMKRSISMTELECTKKTFQPDVQKCEINLILTRQMEKLLIYKKNQIL